MLTISTATPLSDVPLLQTNRYAQSFFGQTSSFPMIKQDKESYTDEELFAAMPLDYEVNIPPRSSRTVKARVVSVQRGTPSAVNFEEL